MWIRDNGRVALFFFFARTIYRATHLRGVVRLVTVHPRNLRLRAVIVVARTWWLNAPRWVN